MRISRIAAATTFVFSAASVNMSAQTVRGLVTDNINHLPVRQVSVALLDARDSSIRIATTNDSGKFQLRVPGAGRYSLDLHHIGFNRLETAPFTIGLKDTLNLVFSMSSNGVVLDTVVSKAAEQKGLFSVTTGMEFVRQHYVSGKGVIISGWLIEKSKKSLSQYLSEQPGLHMSTAFSPGTPTIPGEHGNFILSDSGSQCIYARVDRFSLLYLLMQNTAETIDEVLRVKDIMAVEVFRTFREVPDEWKQDATVSELYNRKNAGITYTIGTTGFPKISDDALSDDALVYDTQLASAGTGSPTLAASRARAPSCAFVQIWTGAAWGDRGGAGGGNH